MGDIGSASTPTVLVTGFGPFRNYAENSSWITVKELPKLNIKDMNIVVTGIPVQYDVVAETIPKLWEEHKPDLTIHCGMSEKANCLTLEQLAHNKYYIAPDVVEKLPAGNICCQMGPNTLYTGLDVHKAIDELQNTSLPVKAEASVDAGNYLCEFIFYTSLRINKNTAFIHIPPINQPYSASEMAESLVFVIRSLLKQCINEPNSCS